MKRLMSWVIAAALVAGSGSAWAQNNNNGVKEDIKDAGKATGNAAKKTGKAIKKGTTKVVHKSAKATKKGAEKVEDKTQKK
jgi:predicted small secreted protein